MSEWIPIEKHSKADPAFHKEVIVYFKQNMTSGLGYLFAGTSGLRWHVTGWKHCVSYDAVSHWMPKPDPPEYKDERDEVLRAALAVLDRTGTELCRDYQFAHHQVHTFCMLRADIREVYDRIREVLGD